MAVPAVSRVARAPRRSQLSTTENAPAPAPAAATAAATPVADPAALGLAAFALTTFLLSAANAGWMTAATGSAWLGYAFAYGGLGIWAIRVAPHAASAAAADHDVGWILLAWAIFNTYMLFWSTAVNGAVFAVFLTLEATEVILFIGNFAASSGVVKLGGYIGVLTALVAWYTSSAVVINTMKGRQVVPVGKAFGPLAA